MKISEAKRRTVVGMTIQAVGHYNPNATGPRVVTKVQTNGFWYSCPRMERAWCGWPPAALTRSNDPDTIVLLLENGEPMTTLHFPTADER